MSPLIQRNIKRLGYLLLVALFIVPTVSWAALSDLQINTILELLRSFDVGEQQIQQVEDALYGRASGEPIEYEVESVDVEEFDSNILRLGQKNPDVFKLQSYLRELGYFSYAGSTNYFGPVTQKAVQGFQRTINGLNPDGIVGPQTMTRLYQKVREHRNQGIPYFPPVETPQPVVIEPIIVDPFVPTPVPLPYPTISVPTPTSPVFAINDLAPRIMYWWGKVNQHIDPAQGGWVTDPDGTSGANLDKLTYCKKWYPNTISVRPYQSEKITTWRQAGNINYHTTTKTSDECVQPIDDTPRIMYWWGKVNQHIDVNTGTWMTDPDGVSGADLDKLTYCRKWYPNTTSVETYTSETINTWRERGNINSHTSTKVSDKCVQSSVNSAS